MCVRYSTCDARTDFRALLAVLGTGLPRLLAGRLALRAHRRPVTTTTRAALAGAITGAVLGLVQWLALKSRLPLPLWWALATSLGMSVGLALSTAFFGSDSRGHELLWRAALTGFSLGLAQWMVLQMALPAPSLGMSALWVVVVGLGWVVGWFITRRAGIDLDLKWPVFGSTGSWAFQLLSGLALYLLLRSSQTAK